MRKATRRGAAEGARGGSDPPSCPHLHDTCCIGSVGRAKRRCWLYRARRLSPSVSLPWNERRSHSGATATLSAGIVAAPAKGTERGYVRCWIILSYRRCDDVREAALGWSLGTLHEKRGLTSTTKQHNTAQHSTAHINQVMNLAREGRLVLTW